MSIARTIFAILLGYLTFLVLGTLGIVVLSGPLRISGGRNLIVGSEVVAFVSAVIAGAITSRAARSRPLAHATALGLSVFSVTVVMAAVMPQRPHTFYPGWYPYAAAILGGVGAFVGGAAAVETSGRSQAG